MNDWNTKIFVKCEKCEYKLHVTLAGLEEWVNKYCPKCNYIPLTTRQEVDLMKERLQPLTSATVELNELLKSKGINLSKNNVNNVELSYNKGNLEVKGF